MIFINIIIIIIIIVIIYCLKYSKVKEINILIENSFKRYYPIPKSPLLCKKKQNIYICNLMFKTNKKVDGIIYNGNLHHISYNLNYSKNIIMASEKVSQVKHMVDIGEGKNKYFQIGVDYRLFNSKHHISFPIYSYINIRKFIKEANMNYGYMSLFLNRKNIVYIQKASYNNRQYLVKEFMKYINVDSYGKDLNNKEWPKNISRRNKLAILKQYKFCLSIENSVISWKIGTKYEALPIDNDYVTEKLIDCLLAGAIPIYFGARTINSFLPHPDCIINFSKYDSVKDLTEYVKIIMNNQSLIEKHVEWHKNISKEWIYRFTKTYSFSYCKICNTI